MRDDEAGPSQPYRKHFYALPLPERGTGREGLTTRVFQRPMKYSVCLPRGDWSGSGSSHCLTRESSKRASCLPRNALFFVPPRDDHPSRNRVVSWRNDR